MRPSGDRGTPLGIGAAACSLEVQRGAPCMDLDNTEEEEEEDMIYVYIGEALLLHPLMKAAAE